MTKTDPFLRADNNTGLPLPELGTVSKSCLYALMKNQVTGFPSLFNPSEN